jgi:hypothetical protein
MVLTLAGTAVGREPGPRRVTGSILDSTDAAFAAADDTEGTMFPALVRVSTCAVLFALTGCGIGEQSPDLFLLTRTGQGKTLTVLVKDNGSIRCNGHSGKPLSDQQLLQARDLQSSLDKDAKAKLHIAPATGSIYTFTVKLQDGTITFADTAGAEHKELAQAELFTVQVAESLCS